MAHSTFQQTAKLLRQLPGIGRKSAERLSFYFVSDKKKALALSNAIQELVKKMQACKTCGLISESQPCKICSSPKRTRSLLCLVKNAQDALMLERSLAYQGLYHVMGGLLSPLEEVSEEDLNINSLFSRAQALSLENKAPLEILFAFEESAEAEVTMLLIRQKLQELKNLKFTQLGVGVPAGTSLSALDSHTLKKSLLHRTALNTLSDTDTR